MQILMPYLIYYGAQCQNLRLCKTRPSSAIFFFKMRLLNLQPLFKAYDRFSSFPKPNDNVKLLMGLNHRKLLDRY